MDVLEKQNRLGQIVAEQRTLVDKYGADKEWSAEDRAKDEKLESEFQTVSNAVEKFKKVEERQKALIAVHSETPKVIGSGSADNTATEVRALLHLVQRTDPAMLSDEIRAAQSSLVAADGGYTVPTTLANEIDKALLDFGGIYSLARKMQMSRGNPFDMPTVNDTANTGAITAQNAAAADAAKVAFGKVTWGSFKVDSGILNVPFELVRDSDFDIVPFLVELIVERVGRQEAAFYAVGTGSGQPQGAVTGASAGTTAAATAITADNVLDLIYSVNKSYRKSKSFGIVMNDQTEKALRKLKDSNGNYIWSMGDIRTGVPSTIWNVPITTDDELADIGTGATSMICGDWNKYIIREIGGGRLRTSEHYSFAEDQLAMLYAKSIDAKVINSAALKKLVHA